MQYEKYPEPFIIKQTDSPDHVLDERSIRNWFTECWGDAVERGGMFPRYTISQDKKALLFECWQSAPIFDQCLGHPRWKSENEDHTP